MCWVSAEGTSDLTAAAAGAEQLVTHVPVLACWASGGQKEVYAGTSACPAEVHQAVAGGVEAYPAEAYPMKEAAGTGTYPRHLVEAAAYRTDTPSTR